ncbi:spermidine synthase [Aquimarina mytili]|uniref:Fused MFS/spermidine synthase n=1 Tax=Aquimarina mytili TaxID=874423 RepID=A0A937D765_9FLAO|nr:fused MFS/spermidine synthase [Aquimarina mytili]MBL0682780.1 fused MFS/spermidine synthase [Aquimarina mytili]
MKKIISHIWPLTKRITSKINGTLEVTWINGKKVLDSEHANYSYGALEKVLTFGLSKIEVSHTAEILLLGLGGGSIIPVLQNRFNHQGKITAVEIDEIVIEIAKNEFNICNSKHLNIICEDASNYVKESTNLYQIIVIDIFIDQIVPELFYKEKFWQQSLRLLQSGGYILFNAGILLKDTSKIESLKSKFTNNITWTEHNNVEGVNTLLIGKKK